MGFTQDAPKSIYPTYYNIIHQDTTPRLLIFFCKIRLVEGNIHQLLHQNKDQLRIFPFPPPPAPCQAPKRGGRGRLFILPSCAITAQTGVPYRHGLYARAARRRGLLGGLYSWASQPRVHPPRSAAGTGFTPRLRPRVTQTPGKRPRFPRGGVPAYSPTDDPQPTWRLRCGLQLSLSLFSLIFGKITFGNTI